MTDVLYCSSLRRRHRRTDVLGLLVIVIDEVYFFRLGFWLQFLLYHLMNRWTRIGFFFFGLRIHGFALLFVGLALQCVVFFFIMGLLYHLLFRIDVGLFFPRWACSVTIFFFSFQILVQKFFLGFFFFFFIESITNFLKKNYLRVFLILLVGFPNFFKRENK